MTYTRRIEVTGEFDAVVAETRAALAAEGFGVLTEIDVKATMKEKIDEDFIQYQILGACNPPVAHQALGTERELGALLPCNVIVYETGDGTITVSTVDPTTLLSLVDNPELEDVADEITDRFDRVLATVSDT